MTKKQSVVLAGKKARTTLIEVNYGRGPETRILTELCLSEGEHLALLNALHQYSETSPVGEDVFVYLKLAMAETNIIV